MKISIFLVFVNRGKDFFLPSANLIRNVGYLHNPHIVSRCFLQLSIVEYIHIGTSLIRLNLSSSDCYI
jgi:hypothetical protein